MDTRFPIRPTEFLCTIVASEWGINISEQEMRAPKPETVQNIYAAILEDLLALDIRTFERESQVAIGDVENPEYYYDAMRLQMLHYHITRVAKVAKVQKFPIKELTRPTGPHLIRVLSAICNFRAFADVDERQNFLLDLQQQAENKQARLDDSMAALAEAEEDLDTLQLTMENDKPALVQIKANIDNLKAELKTQMHEMEKLAKAKDEYRTLRKDLKTRMESLTNEIQELHRSNTNDKSRVMQSPERVKKKIQDMATNSEQLKPQITQIDSMRAMYAAKEAVLKTLVQNTRDAMRDLEGLKDDLDQFNRVQEDYARATANHTQSQMNHSILVSQLAQADRQRQRAEEKLADVRASHQQKQEMAQKRHEVLEERYRSLLNHRGERDLDDSKMRERMDAILKEQDKFIEEQQADIDSLYEEYQNLRDVVRTYTAELDTHLGLGVAKQDGKRIARTTTDPPKKKKKKKRKTTETNGNQNDPE